MEKHTNNTATYHSLLSVIIRLIGIFLLLVLLAKIQSIILLFILSFIFAIVLNPIVTFMEIHNIPRAVGSVLTVSLIIFLIILFFVLIVPEIIKEGTNIAQDLPNVVQRVIDNINQFLNTYTSIKLNVNTFNFSNQLLTSMQPIISRFFSISITIIHILLFTVVFLSVLTYTLIKPRSILETYLRLFPSDMQEKAQRAYIHGSKMTIGWMKSNIIIGAIEGVAAALFLTWFGIPGAVLWGALTMVSELVPKIGPYIMTIPPVLLAFSIDPVKAVWVFIFYIVLQLIAGDVLAPYIRSSEMTLHPVYIIFSVLTMSYLFGFTGAVIAVPIAGFIKAFYDEFYMKEKKTIPSLEKRMKEMLGY